MFESSIAFETRPEIVSSLLSASVLILSCFLAFESNIFWVLCRIPEPRPSKSPVEARTTLTATPIPVIRRGDGSSS